jgi:RNA recognition motif-containing protein
LDARRRATVVFGSGKGEFVMGSRLYVGNLSYQTTEDDLRQLFMGAGSVTSVSIITERDTGRSKGFAFVEMANDEDANKAQQMFNGHSLHNRTLRVDLARPREDRGGGGGGGGFRGEGGGGGGRRGDYGGGRGGRGGRGGGGGRY